MKYLLYLLQNWKTRFRRSRVLLHLRRLTTDPEKPVYITMDGRSDGAGAQLHGLISVMALAQEAGWTYLHTPVQNLEHNYTGDPGYDSRWEIFANLGAGEIQIAETEKLWKQEKRAASFLKLAYTPGTLFKVTQCHHLTKIVPEVYESLMPKLRQRYLHSPIPKTTPFTKDALNIALHVRRGDVQAQDNANRFTGNTQLRQIIEDLTRKLAGYNPRIFLYSQGDPTDFAEIDTGNIHFQLDIDPLLTWHHLIMADVLVMAKSSFSYTAGLLSSGIVLYQPFWHPPLDSWISMSECNEQVLDRVKARADDVLHQRRPQ